MIKCPCGKQALRNSGSKVICLTCGRWAMRSRKTNAIVSYFGEKKYHDSLGKLMRRFDKVSKAWPMSKAMLYSALHYWTHGSDDRHQWMFTSREIFYAHILFDRIEQVPPFSPSSKKAFFNRFAIPQKVYKTGEPASTNICPDCGHLYHFHKRDNANFYLCDGSHVSIKSPSPSK